MIKLTTNELQALKGIDHSEYGEYLCDAVWTFSVSDNSDLKPRSVPGVIASLLKKGLVSVGGDGSEQNDYSVGMTQLGIETYIAAVGKLNVKKAPSFDTYDAFRVEQAELHLASEKKSVVLTGISTNEQGHTPKFNMLVDGQVVGKIKGGWRYATIEEAQAAGERAVKFFEQNGMFPNMCEAF